MAQWTKSFPTPCILIHAHCCNALRVKTRAIVVTEKEGVSHIFQAIRPILQKFLWVVLLPAGALTGCQRVTQTSRTYFRIPAIAWSAASNMRLHRDMSDARKPLLEVRGLCKIYRQGRWWERRFQVRALDNVELTLHAGSTSALVGESGSGKTTLAMCLMGLENPDAGDIRLDGQSLHEQGRRERARNIQLIFQDSAGALNPSMSASEIIEEPLLILGKESGGPRRKQVSKAMEQVGLPVSWGHRR